MKRFGEVEMFQAQKLYHDYTVRVYITLWESFDKDLRNAYFDLFYPMELSPTLQKIADMDEVFLWVWKRGIKPVPLVMLIFDYLGELCREISNSNNVVFTHYNIPLVPVERDESCILSILEDLEYLYPGVLDMYRRYQEISKEEDDLVVDSKQIFKDFCWVNRVIREILEDYVKELKHNTRMPPAISHKG